MKRKYYLLVAIVLVGGGVVLLGLAVRPAVVTTRVVLSGAEGLAVTGSFTADGKEYEVNETLPAEITATARRLSLVLASADQGQNVTAQVFVEGKPGVSGAQRHIRVDVRGNTLLRSTPRVQLKAY
ncbi:MAG: hypothetical protein JSW27_25025 [Phycisphaerales bacterium]|nr:MAG: hypothetical protein JSW27_25025 [Phycisphaerales bacterium]